MKCTGKDGSVIEGEESPYAVIGKRAAALWFYHVFHDPLIRFPERRSPATQPRSTPRQSDEDDTDDQST